MKSERTTWKLDVEYELALYRYIPDYVSRSPLKVTGSRSRYITLTTTFTATTTTVTMSDEGYPASAWDHTDNETLASTNYQNLRVPQTQPQPYHSDDSLVAGPPTDVLVLSKSNTSPRSSVESPTRMANQRWSSVPPSEPVQSEENIVEAGFDENVLHALLELDVRPPTFLFIEYTSTDLIDRIYASVAHRCYLTESSRVWLRAECVLILTTKRTILTICP